MVLTHGEFTLQGLARDLLVDPRVMASYMGQAV
jgi:ABC-type branched-subunit amino acid transport system ATPase component